MCCLIVLGVDLALLLASSLFVLHFIPNIGAAVATIPAVLAALASQGPGTAALVAIGYLLINLLVGNVLDPRVLGRTLGLSPLAVLLGMLFWGWLWGPAGALLSVPIMMVAKITLENVDGLSWVARIMKPRARGARDGARQRRAGARLAAAAERRGSAEIRVAIGGLVHQVFL